MGLLRESIQNDCPVSYILDSVKEYLSFMNEDSMPTDGTFAALKRSHNLTRKG